MLAPHLQFLGLYHLALHPLICGIFSHETQAAVHLGKILRAENKHQLILQRAVAVHVTHGLDILLLLVVELRIQLVKTVLMLYYIEVKLADHTLYRIDALALVGYLGIEHHQALQPFFHVALIGAQPLLMLPYLLLYPVALALQSLYRRRLGRRAPCRSRPLAGRSHSRPLPGSGLAFLRLCRHGKDKQKNEYPEYCLQHFIKPIQ